VKQRHARRALDVHSALMTKPLTSGGTRRCLDATATSIAIVSC
jgi:hypothetical protein